MSDCISRQAAIDALDVLCQEHRYKIPGKAETYSQYNEAWQDALDRAEGVIFNCPPAQPEQRWIPCSERLPEYDCEVLTYTDSGEYIVGCRHNEWGQDCWTTEAFGSGTYEAVAWMPMPEPYQSEAERRTDEQTESDADD